jgi:hypothetical protein
MKRRLKIWKGNIKKKERNEMIREKNKDNKKRNWLFKWRISKENLKINKDGWNEKDRRKRDKRTN